MTISAFLLDTNAYALFFQNPRSPNLSKMESSISLNGCSSFYIPEIVSMEIHSVLGKYRRGGASSQQVACDRRIVGETSISACLNTCIFPARTRMSTKVFKNVQKMINDIEAGRGDIRATIITLGTDEFNVARQLLVDYADRYSFGSHDALVAASAVVAKANGMELTLVTSDKGLKAVCVATGLPVLDPAH